METPVLLLPYDIEFISVHMDHRGRRHPNQVKSLAGKVSWTSKFIAHCRKYRHTLQHDVVSDKKRLG